MARPWLTGRVTAAVLARKVDEETPTLLLDESDAAFNGEKEYAEALRGILNSGYRRSGKASVCVGQGANIGYVDLSTFGAKAIAGIGNLPDTVASRSIPIRLKRKAPDETVERFHERRARDEAEPLHQALTSLGVEYVDRLAEAEPELLAELPDRAADVWEPLLAIADLAGDEWPQRARQAAVDLSGRGQAVDQSESIRLLADCRAAFNGHDRLSTKDLIAVLSEDEEAPWGTWHRAAGGRAPISPRALAGQLEPFGIRSRTIRLDDGTTPKGFHVDQFADAWKRYLNSPNPPDPGQQTPHPPQPASVKGLRALSQTPQDPFVADRESAANPHGKPVVAGVADEPPKPRAKSISSTSGQPLWASCSSTSGRARTNESGRPRVRQAGSVRPRFRRARGRRRLLALERPRPRVLHRPDRTAGTRGRTRDAASGQRPAP